MEGRKFEGTLIAHTSESQPFYTYQSLRAPRYSFRILELQPLEHGGIVRGSLRTTLTNRTAHYVALSYEWGPADDYDLVEIDSLPFRVRRNLWSCLNEYSRRLTAPECVFVDAICVDQSNTQERSAQVAIMGMIFGRAREVFIWLGADPSGCAALFQMANSIAKGAPTLVSMYMEEDEAESSGYNSDQLLQVVPLSHLDLAARRFDDASASYFSRAWIVQEVVLARQASLNCGHVCVSWENLSAAMERLVLSWPKYNESPSDHAFCAMDELAQRYRLRWSETPSLTQYMLLMSDKKCADIRDRFYSIVGLLRKGPMVDVNYTNTRPEMFLEALSYGITAGVIHGRQGSALSPDGIDLMGYLRDAFNLQEQLQMTIKSSEYDFSCPPKVAAELHFTGQKKDFLANFAQKPLFSRFLEDECTVHTIRRTSYEAWKPSATPLLNDFRFPSIVLTDNSLGGLAVIVWLGRLNDDMAEELRSFDADAEQARRGNAYEPGYIVVDELQT